jgi:hypothetical protein
VHRDGRSLGIEITRFSPSPDGTAFVPEEQEALRGRALELARDTYNASGGDPLHVQALFRDHPRLRQDRVRPLAKELASLLLTKTADVQIYGNVEFDGLDDYHFMPEIGEVTAVRVPTLADSGWAEGRAAFLRKADFADFQRVLVGKEPRVPRYRAAVNEIWLLIIFETLPGNIQVQIPTEVGFTLETGFDRVFALQRVSAHCIEIPVQVHEP